MSASENSWNEIWHQRRNTHETHRTLHIFCLDFISEEGCIDTTCTRLHSTNKDKIEYFINRPFKEEPCRNQSSCNYGRLCSFLHDGDAEIFFKDPNPKYIAQFRVAGYTKARQQREETERAPIMAASIETAKIRSGTTFASMFKQDIPNAYTATTNPGLKGLKGLKGVRVLGRTR